MLFVIERTKFPILPVIVKLQVPVWVPLVNVRVVPLYCPGVTVTLVGLMEIVVSPTIVVESERVTVPANPFRPLTLTPVYEMAPPAGREYELAQHRVKSVTMRLNVVEL